MPMLARARETFSDTPRDDQETVSSAKKVSFSASAADATVEKLPAARTEDRWISRPNEGVR